MGENCPTCGQKLPTTIIDDTARLLYVLTNGSPHREVYRGSDGSWWITYGGGPVSYGAVQALLSSGKIASVYSNAPNDAYHVGQTLDVAATDAARRVGGKNAPLVCVREHATILDGEG